MSYYQKYLKYKSKYLGMKGGGQLEEDVKTAEAKLQNAKNQLGLSYIILMTLVQNKTYGTIIKKM